jgi:tetratricopeptide (TPR) repeat protein
VIDMTTAQNLRRCSVAALVLALSGLPAAADFDTAMAHLKSGNYLEAASEFQALVDESPDYADGYHLLGICFLKSDKYQDAEKNLLKAIELNGDKFDFYYNLANAYRVQNKHDKVVKTMNNAEGLASDKLKYRVYQMRGHAYASQKKWADAIDDLERAVAAKPDAATQAQLGKAYFFVGDNRSAVTALRKARQMGAGSSSHKLLVEAMINVAAKTTGGEAAKKAKYGEALAEAERYLSANAGSAEARYLVGRTALGAGQFDKAIGAFQDVIKKKPDHCNAMTNMGKAYQAKGDWPKAASALENATSCDPKLGMAWETKGFVHQKMGSSAKDFAVKRRNYEKAIAAYEKAQAIKSKQSTSTAIATCKQNLQIAKENQMADMSEAEQKRAIEEEEARVAAEEAKREAWKAKQEDD